MTRIIQIDAEEQNLKPQQAITNASLRQGIG